MTFLLGAALFAGAVVFFVLQPMLAGRSAPTGRDDEEMTDAEARRRVTLLALRDVEYDRETGKLDDIDYRALRKELSVEALDAIRAEKQERTVRSAGASGGTIVLSLEDEVRRVRQGLRSGRTCAGCGHLNRAASRFCSGCGRPLAQASDLAEGTTG